MLTIIVSIILGLGTVAAIILLGILVEKLNIKHKDEVFYYSSFGIVMAFCIAISVFLLKA